MRGEERRALVRELELGRIEQVEHRDVVAPRREPPEGGHQVGVGVEEVGEDDGHGAPPACAARSDRCSAAVPVRPRGLQPHEAGQHLEQVRARGARRQLVAHLGWRRCVSPAASPWRSAR